MSSQVSNCRLLLWLCVVPNVTHFLTWVAPCLLMWLTTFPLELFVISCVPVLLTWVALCHFKCPITAHWSGSKWSQVSYCHSIVWICVILGVFLPLTGVALCHSTCPLPLMVWVGSASSQACHCWSLESFPVILGLQLPLTGVTPCHPSCPEADTSSGSVSSQVSHCHKLG